MHTSAVSVVRLAGVWPSAVSQYLGNQLPPHYQLLCAITCRDMIVLLLARVYPSILLLPDAIDLYIL